MRIAQDYSDAYQDDIVLVLYNRRLRELNKCADGDGTVEFLTTADKTGKKAYRRSVTLLMQKAVYNLWGKGNISVRVKYSIGQGNYCELVKWENDTEEVVKVSGHNPSLDSIDIFQKTAYMTKRQPARRWGVGVTAGYGIGKHGLSPYVGIGGFYRIW